MEIFDKITCKVKEIWVESIENINLEFLKTYKWLKKITVENEDEEVPQEIFDLGIKVDVST